MTAKSVLFTALPTPCMLKRWKTEGGPRREQQPARKADQLRVADKQWNRSCLVGSSHPVLSREEKRQAPFFPSTPGSAWHTNQALLAKQQNTRSLGGEGLQASAPRTGGGEQWYLSQAQASQIGPGKNKMSARNSCKSL